MFNPETFLLRVAITLLPSCLVGRYVIGAMNVSEGQSIALLFMLMAICALLSLFLVESPEQAQDSNPDFFARNPRQRNRLTLTMGWERVSRNGTVNRRVMMMAV